MNAVLILIGNMSRNEHKPLILGNVINKLGQPSFVNHNEYVFDESGNTMVEVPRTQIYYDNKNVMIGFSPLGFLTGVSYKVKPEEWKGYGCFSWSQAMLKSQKTPIVSESLGVAKRRIEELVKVANRLRNTNRSERDWYKFTFRDQYPANSDIPIPNIYDVACSAKVFIVDVISEEIAKVHYQICDPHRLYIETWWLHTCDGWQMITAKKAEGIFRNYAVNLQTDSEQ